MSEAVLRELLDTGRRYAPEYTGALSNHLPMALVALQRLGADDERLRVFFDDYARRLSLVAQAAAPDTDWRAALGRFGPARAFADLQAGFDAQLRSRGRAALLHEVLPVLMEGIGAAAFHGLIRTAYALDAGHDGELAAGLAYWTLRHLPLPAPPAALPMQADPARWLDALNAEIVVRIEGGLIFERMRTAARQAGFERHANALVVDAGTLQRLAELAARTYAATRDFTVLHLVTSAHALRLLLPQLPDEAARAAALQAYARAYAAGVVASGAALDAAEPHDAGLSWTELEERARRSADDHVIKLVYSAREEARACGSDAHRRAAQRAVGA